MATDKKSQKSSGDSEAQADSLWRKPITLDSFDDEDPLATLYLGRETDEVAAKAESKRSKKKEITAPAEPKTRNSGAIKPEARKTSEKKSAETPANVQKTTEEIPKIAAQAQRMSETELKNVLRIKSDTFHFTDVREILRGKSLEIYAYLRFLSGDSGVCKIKHLDLMKILDISRPTLFKQGEWLMRLSLIEKSNVPGDHLGTSYNVRRLEEVLPVSEDLVRQLESQIESFQQV